MGLHVQTLSEQVYALLRDRFASGAMTAHDSIRQDALATELGVSKIPVREALIRLENEGLITSEANRGFFVPPLTLDEVEDVFALRLTMEPQTVGLAARRASDADREKARAALRDLEDTTTRNPHLIGKHNRLFHLALIQPSRRPVTIRFLQRLHLISERNTGNDPLPDQEDEHRALYKLWAEGNDKAVVGLMHQHIEHTYKALLTQYDGPKTTFAPWKQE